MDGGVPMKKPVAGIAMGLVIEGDRVAVLSDILGAEDHLGDMDFKVTGTADGITAFQLDTKIAGISDAVMMKALAQAKVGRMHILNEMNKTLAQSRADISPFAPKVTTIQIPVDKIREIIGPGGKIVKRIQEESGAKIEIEDDGTVRVIAVNTEAAEIALGRIREITAEPEVGKTYEGEVRSILAFGAFVQIMPGRDGLLHISEIAHRRLERVEDELQVGDIVKVKVLEVQADGKVRLSRKALLEKPEGYQEEERSERPHRSSGDRDHGRSSGGGRRHERSRR
jgi:polyribonucleotide nucleotidyltransferase